MCGGRPFFNSCCGLSLQKSVIVIGIIELIITLIATILNMIKLKFGPFGAFDERYKECIGRDLCFVPMVKYAMFDAFFGIISSLMLIFGAHLRNNCLLITWALTTVLTSTKYIHVLDANDWSRLEVNLLIFK